VIRFALAAVFAFACAPAFAGYEAPNFIDGGQSADGRFVVVAEPVGKLTNHGPNKWRFVWKDTKENKTITSDAKDVSAGQVYAQLFVAPDGETFALWNHVTLWASEKSGSHGAAKLTEPGTGRASDRTHEAYSRRLVIYKKDGTVVKALGANDILTADEWDAALVVFNRLHWVREYDGLSYRKTPRPAYAFTRVSPDYTVLAFRVTPTRADKTNMGREVRVDLTTGALIAATEKLSAARTPVRMFKGAAELPDATKETREGFVPSLDPVRSEGKFPAK
jgi:hypothetical protein